MGRGNTKRNIPPISMSLRSRDGEEELQDLNPPPGAGPVAHSPPNLAHILNDQETERSAENTENEGDMGPPPDFRGEMTRPLTLGFQLLNVGNMRHSTPVVIDDFNTSHQSNPFGAQNSAACTQTDERTSKPWGNSQSTATSSSDNIYG
ncbi:unnamed protein product, partial [Allacma fusca]